MHVEQLRSDCVTAWQRRWMVAGACGALLFAALIAPCLAQPPETVSPSETDVMTLPIERLFDIEVITAARRPQTVAETASAVFVITQEDIRRSGVTSIPEALRLAPGVNATRIDANKWAITIRGFNSRFANKLLVLIDGRSVYTPFFAGVYWDVQDTLLEDIDRIEVIRGPGASLWGANAVNGIINIITKQARDTQGGLVTAGVGSEDRVFGGARYGISLGDNATIRVYGKGFKREESDSATNLNVDDAWYMLRAGMRLDWDISTRDTLTVQGDIYTGEINEDQANVPLPVPPFSGTVNNDLDTSGGNVLARLQHRFSASSEMALQLYYDRTDRDEEAFREIRDTIDLDFQHEFTFTWGVQHEMIWGLGYRFSRDDFTNSFIVRLDPDNRNVDLFSAFVQDDITLIENQLRLTLGSKFEHNDFTGFEVQPTARLLWTPQARHTVWAAISRAVRTPSRQQDDIQIQIAVVPPVVPTSVLTVLGNRDSDSEELLAFELGYRILPIDQLSIDFTAFYNDYDELQTFEPGMPIVDPTLSPLLIFPLNFDNKLQGETFGLELVIDWQPLDWWRLQVWYSYLQINLSLDDDSGDTFSEVAERENPHHQVSFRSSMDLPWNLEFDLWLRYVDALSGIDVNSYVTMDVRLAWRPFQNLELSLAGQNLVQKSQAEFVEANVIPAKIQRGVYGKITWQF